MPDVDCLWREDYNNVCLIKTRVSVQYVMYCDCYGSDMSRCPKFSEVEVEDDVQ